MPGRPFTAFPLRSPVMVAAGALPADGLAGLLHDEYLGAVVTPSFTLRPRRGVPAMVRESVGGVVVSPAGTSAGIISGLRRLSHAWSAARVPVVVSLTVDEAGAYVPAAAHLEGVPGPAAIELNLAWGDIDGLVAEDPGLVRGTVRAVRQVCRLPVVVKLPYDLAEPESAVEACAAAGATAAVVAAGVPTSDGMLVGPATFPLVLEVVRRLAREAPLPLIACGGVATAAAARACLAAGAAAVQVGSAHLANPRAAADLARELAGATPSLSPAGERSLACG